MTEPRQKIMEEIGKFGCYFLCLVRIAEEETGHRIDAIPFYTIGQRLGYIVKECFINDPAKLLGLMTKKRWKVKKESPEYKAEPSEREVLHYVYRIGHFVLPDYDPYGDSETVRKGRLESKRIFEVVP
jgi:hypothetical protein